MSRVQEIIRFDMSSYSRNGQIGRRNYKYRRLSSAENGSIQNYASFHEDDDEIFTGDEFELQKRGHSRGKESGPKTSKLLGEYECLVDRPVLKGDTLRGLALHYGIPVFELKRVNKIVHESEFYALQSIKIPVKPEQAVLAEMLEKERLEYTEEVTAARENVLGTRSLSSCSENESESEMHVGYISIDRILKDTCFKKEAKKFFENMQHDLTLIREKNKTYKDNLDEAAAALTDIRFYPIENKKSNCSGADWGLKWWVLVIIGAVFLIGVPIYFAVYVYENYTSTDEHSNAGGQEIEFTVTDQ